MPVLGITGTGGSGKSSLTDELLNRLRLDQEDKLRIAVLAVDPTRRKGGGALLGDRIRMNSIGAPNVFFRSLATRSSAGEVPEALAGAIDACKAAGFDLVIVETPGIGQGDAGIVPYSDVSLYVMTPEFGAASQLEKIDMLDFADAVAINKFDRRGGADALRDVRRQVARERPEVPVFGTIASRFNDDGVTALYQHLRSGARPRRPACWHRVAHRRVDRLDRRRAPGRVSATWPRSPTPCGGYHAETDERVARRPAPAAPAHREATCSTSTSSAHLPARDPLLDEWPDSGRRSRAPRCRTSLSGTLGAQGGDRLAPRTTASCSGSLRRENLPGRFPFTAGVFPFKREDEDPGADVRGRGRPGPHQPPVPPAGRRDSRRRVCRPRSTR